MKSKSVKLGDVIRVYSGVNLTQEKMDYSGKYPVYGGNGITGKHSKFNIEDSTVLIGRVGYYCGSVHITEGKAWVTDNAFVTKFSPDTFHKKYLYYLLRNLNLRQYSNSSAQPVISGGRIYSIECKIPPLSVQREIAEILDKADTLRQKDQLLLQKYDELAQSVFYDMFGDPVKNEKGWEVKPLEDFVSENKYALKRGPFGGSLKKEIFVKDGYLVYEQYHAINDKYDLARYYIDDEKYNELEMFSVMPGDLIVSCSGVTLGRISEIPAGAKKGVINQALLKISLDNQKITNEFFKFQFRSPLIQGRLFSTSRGSGIPNFPPMEDIKKLLFFVPPLQVQKYFTEMYNNILAQRTLVSQTTSDLLFQAKLYKYFN